MLINQVRWFLVPWEIEFVLLDQNVTTGDIVRKVRFVGIWKT